MDTSMAKYILSILRSNSLVVMSWGAHNFKATATGLSFQVNGFIFTGKVVVEYDEGPDLFTIRFYRQDGSLFKVEDYVYVDALVYVIDRNVENTGNQEEYKSRVEAEYGF